VYQSNTDPVFTEVTIVAPQVLTAGNSVRGTTNLLSQSVNGWTVAVPGMHLLVRVGLVNTTALNATVAVKVRPVAGGPTGTRIHPVGGWSRTVQTTAAGASTFISSTAAAGATSLTVNSGTGFTAAGGDVLCVADGNGAGGLVNSANGTLLSRCEFLGTSKASGATLTLDAPTQYQHTAANQDLITSGATVFARTWIPGGNIVEVVFDWGAAASTGPIIVEAIGELQLSDLTQQ
jgi:hypothetical protein